MRLAAGEGLVEAAAQGVEEGGIRPLTTLLGGSTRRQLVLGGRAVWGSLRRMEAGLTEGAVAFEVGIAGMGVMEADALDALGVREGAGGESGHARDGGGRTGCAGWPVGAGGGRGAGRGGGGEHEEAVRAGGRGGAGLAAEDGGEPDQGVGRVQGEDGGHGRDGGERARCARCRGRRGA